jgi:predicted nucleic acid-binding protein
MELVQGMRNKKELALLKKYFLSNSMELQDALIASTSLTYNEILLTANEKHYQFLPNIQINKFIP